jgi:hypothetical protein
MFKIENFIKGPLMSLFAFLVMVAVAYAWYIGYATDVQAIFGEMFGFALLFMRDDLPKYIGRFFSALISRIFNKDFKDEKNTPPPAV